MHLSGNALVMKEININLVRSALKAKIQATKQQIAEETGLSSVTVTTVLEQLVVNNEAFEADLVPSNGGRPAHQYRFNENHAHILVLFTHEKEGMDIAYIRVVNLFGECVCEYDTPLHNISLKYFELFIDRFLQEDPTVRAIGFGMPAIESGGKIILSDYKALLDTPFSDHYRARYRLPVLFENDVNAAVVGFCKQKQLKAEAATVYLYFPEKYPPGAGIYINGSLYKGFNGYAGEVANLPLGIDWHDAKLYRVPAVFCKAVAKVITSVCSMLNPHSVILYGGFLKTEHIQTITQECFNTLPKNTLPVISLSQNFTLDYQNGLIAETLALLEPQLILSN